MKFWEDFYNEVMPYVENCPTPIIKHQLINAAIEFCQRTALWRVQLDPINILANESEYPISYDITSDQSVSSLDYAYLIETAGNTPLPVTSEDEMKINDSLWRTKTAPKPTAIMMLTTENIKTFPIPEDALPGGLSIGIILKPSRESAGLPDWIHEQWAEKIAYGAKAKLFSMKSRSWYDPKESIDEQDNFDMAIKDATIRATKGHSRKNTNVQMRPMA